MIYPVDPSKRNLSITTNTGSCRISGSQPVLSEGVDITGITESDKKQSSARSIYDNIQTSGNFTQKNFNTNLR